MSQVPDLPEHPYYLTAQEVCDQLDVDPSVGLSSEEVERRRNKFGRNELEKVPGKTMFQLVLEQFDDPLVKILLGAAAISFALSFYEGETFGQALVEPAVIIIILVLNAIVGVWQEASAETALERLKEMQPQHAYVRRNGNGWEQIDAVELVPGDVIRVSVGDSVPSDCRIVNFETATLKTVEGALTGESTATSKQVEPLELQCVYRARECCCRCAPRALSPLAVARD